jgi:predicted ATPase
MSAPRRSRSLIGRSRDLATLAGLLERERLVTILGPPGMGKTRLAERHLEIQRSRTDVALAVFCDLTEATGIDDICRFVARALDVPIGNGDGGVIVEQLGRIMASRGAVLLVLDNFEQVVAGAAATVGAWLRQAPEARILVTSRERLNLKTEALFDLGPLSLPGDDGDAKASAAVQLFVERAQAASHDYVLTDFELPTVAAIVRGFEGIPLAIELASARMRVLTSAEILGSLSLDVSAGNAADAPARHASLRHAIAWSWGSLQPWEQAALGQCTVFQGGFSVSAAQAVIDVSAYPGAPAPVDVLESLRNKSLLLRHDLPEEPARARFRLYVSIQEFGREKLVESGGVDGAEARHARHFLAEGRAWAAAVNGPSAAEALCRLGVETENLLAVHRRAMGRAPRTADTVTEAIEVILALQRVLLMRGPVPRLLALLDGALSVSHVAEVAAPLRATAFLRRGQACWALVRAPEAQADYERALVLAEGASETSLAGEIHVSLGWIHAASLRASDAEGCFARAVATGDRHVQGQAHMMLSTVRWRQERVGEAIAMLEAALTLHREVGDPISAGQTLANLAVMKGEAGQVEEACTESERACAILAALGLRRSWAIALGNWGALEHVRGRFASAESLYERALQACREIGVPDAYVSVSLGILHEAMGHHEEAAACCERGLLLLSGSGYPEEALAMATLAGLDAAGGRIELARARFEAVERSTFHGAHIPAIFWVLRGHLDLALARAALANGDPGAAAEHERSARRRARYAPDAGEASGSHPDRAGSPGVWLGIDVRFAQLSVESALVRHASGPSPVRGREIVSRDPLKERDSLTISLTHCWFQPPGGQRISLLGKPVLARLLRGFTEQWERAPGASLSIEALREIGWPNEQMSPKAGIKRVYTAIWSLRRLGLSGALAQRQGEYLLSPDTPVRVIDAPF